MFGSILVGHMILYIIAKLIKGNNEIVADFDPKIANLEKTLAQSESREHKKTIKAEIDEILLKQA